MSVANDKKAVRGRFSCYRRRDNRARKTRSNQARATSFAPITGIRNYVDQTGALLMMSIVVMARINLSGVSCVREESDSLSRHTSFVVPGRGR